MKIIKSLDKSTHENQLQAGCHSINFCSWERLRPYLEQATGNKAIKGIRATDEGVEIILKD
jgi:hypothetical protein